MPFTFVCDITRVEFFGQKKVLARNFIQIQEEVLKKDARRVLQLGLFCDMLTFVQYLVN